MSATDLSFVKGKPLRWPLLLLIASLPLLGWWAYGLFDLDEGFYAAVTGSMIRHGEWITPLYNGKPWFEKPILIYWLSKPSIMLFGQAFGPRLPSVLCTIATYAIVAWFVRKRIGAMAAVMSLFILGSSLLVIIVGRMMMTDAPLLFFFTAAMLAYYESLVGDPRWKLVTAACLGFAVLAKGPVAIILFVLIAGWLAISTRSKGRKGILEQGSPAVADEVPRKESGVQGPPPPVGEVSRSDGGGVYASRPVAAHDPQPTANSSQPTLAVWPLGTLILFAIIACWYLPAYLANGHTFVQEFLIKQNIGRFTGGDPAHTMPFLKSFWFYIPVLLIGMAPWIFFLPAAWPRKPLPLVPMVRAAEEEVGGTETPDERRSRDIGGAGDGGSAHPESRIPHPASHLKLFLAGWASIVFIFFTISGAKLPHYVLPCCPPIAILVATYLANRWESLDRSQIRPKLFLTLGWLTASWIIVQVGFEYWYVKSGQQDAHATARWIAQQNATTQFPIAEYQLPRRNKDLGTGKPKLQETSLPSLSFYLNADIIESDNLQSIPAAPNTWIFTRVGRISAARVTKSQSAGSPYFLAPERTSEYYVVYLYQHA